MKLKNIAFKHYDQIKNTTIPHYRADSGSNIHIRRDYPAGCKVELIHMDDPQAPPIGTIGIVTGVDDTGSLLMHWENGSSLNVVYGEDAVKKL